MELRQMTVLVTGAAGNLGSATCEQLIKAGIEVRATDQMTRKSLPYRVIVANLLSRESCYSLLEGCDAVVHLGNRPNERAGTAQQIFGENGTMNVNVFQAALELGVKKVVYASSIQAIIGSRKFGQAVEKPSCHGYLPADGDTPACAGNHYSASKVAGETLLKYYAEHQELGSGTAIRFPGMVKPEWFDWMKRHMDVEKSWRDEYIDEVFAFLTFADAGRLVAAVLKAELPGYRCYLPAYPAVRVSMSEKELIARYFPTVALKKPAEEMQGLVDISQITRETGWIPEEDFRK
jgi:nucleoside-diphosphate-sugar epimerase